jgi:hypothetical protein
METCLHEYLQSEESKDEKMLSFFHNMNSESNTGQLLKTYLKDKNHIKGKKNCIKRCTK